MNFNWAVAQMKLGSKVRRLAWTNEETYIYLDPKTQMIRSIGGKLAYFMIDHFTKYDWAIYEDKPKQVETNRALYHLKRAMEEMEKKQ